MEKIDPWKMAVDNQGLIKAYLDKNRWIIDRSHTLEWEDYWQIGLISLYKAARRHNASKTRFSSYAWICLKWNLTRAFKTQAFPIMRVPERKHPKKNATVADMSYQESFTFNVLNCRVDLSSTNYLQIEKKNEEEESMFVFFN